MELRTSRVRLVIAPETLEMVAPDLLSRVVGTANELETVQSRLRRMADEVPEPPDGMLEHEMPYDLHAELLTTLECVAEDDLDGAIETLRAAAAATPEQLRRLWEEAREPETATATSAAPAGADLIPAGATGPDSANLGAGALFQSKVSAYGERGEGWRGQSRLFSAPPARASPAAIAR